MKNTFYLVLVTILFSCISNKNWQDRSASITENLHDIEVIAPTTAIAYSYGTGSLFKTTNTGKDWTPIYEFDSIYFEQIQFLDNQHGWIGGSPNQLYFTQDGGENWVSKSLPVMTTPPYIYGMWFETIAKGFVAALTRGKKGFSTAIMQTNDGGNTWQIVNQLDEMILHLEPINGVLYATGNNVIIKNIDRTDWSYVYQDTSKTVGQIRDIANNESGKIYAVSFNGYIIELANDMVEIRQITKNRIRNLVAIDHQQWMVVGDANTEVKNLFFSPDNGLTWKPTEDSFSDIHRIETSSKHVWIVGKEGLIRVRKR